MPSSTKYSVAFFAAPVSKIATDSWSFGYQLPPWLNNNTIEYINKLRVEKAKEIIQHENVSFKEIAGRVGIDNIYYFYRIFKKYTDMTMGQYLKMLYR